MPGVGMGLTRLAAWRRVQGKSQKALAAELGFNPYELSMLETGRAKPTARQHARLVEYFGSEARVAALLATVRVVA